MYPSLRATHPCSGGCPHQSILQRALSLVEFELSTRRQKSLTNLTFTLSFRPLSYARTLRSLIGSIMLFKTIELRLLQVQYLFYACFHRKLHVCMFIQECQLYCTYYKQSNTQMYQIVPSTNNTLLNGGLKYPVQHPIIEIWH